jgi:uncharacterized protein
VDIERFRPVPARGRLLRVVLLVAGALLLVVAAIGVVVPVLPTTPFLILAAICFARSSPRVYRWLVTNRVFGRHLDDYLHGRGVSWKVRATTLVFLWAVITVSAVVFVDKWWLRVLLFAIAAGVTAHVVLLPRRGAAEEG